MVTADLVMKVFWGQYSTDNVYFTENTLVFDIESDEFFMLEDLPEDFEPTETTYYLVLDAVSTLLESLVKDWGRDVVYQLAIPDMKQLIKDVKAGPSTLDEYIKWEEPKNGELIMIYNLNTWQDNNPEDPTEWNTDLTCSGILGYNIKLIKNGN